MREKTLKYVYVVICKNKTIHASKKPIALNLQIKDSIDKIAQIASDIDKIAISDKFKHNDEGLKYFISDEDCDIIRPSWIVLPQMREYIRYFDESGKNVCFVIEDDNLLVKYNEISNKVKQTVNIKFYSKLVYDEKYRKRLKDNIEWFS